MSGDTKISGEIHNFRNEYKYKFGAHQNASGRWQLEFKIQSDFRELIVGEIRSLVKDFRNMMKEEGCPPVELKEKKDTKEEEKSDG